MQKTKVETHHSIMPHCMVITIFESKTNDCFVILSLIWNKVEKRLQNYWSNMALMWMPDKMMEDLHCIEPLKRVYDWLEQLEIQKYKNWFVQLN